MLVKPIVKSKLRTAGYARHLWLGLGLSLSLLSCERWLGVEDTGSGGDETEPQSVPEPAVVNRVAAGSQPPASAVVGASTTTQAVPGGTYTEAASIETVLPSGRYIALVIANRDFDFREYEELRQELSARGHNMAVFAPARRVAIPLEAQAAGGAAVVLPESDLRGLKAEEFDSLVLLGGRGAMSMAQAFPGTLLDTQLKVDGAAAAYLATAVKTLWGLARPVAAICHGIAALAWLRPSADSSPVQHKDVTLCEGSTPGFVDKNKRYEEGSLPLSWNIEQNLGRPKAPLSMGNPVTSADDVVTDGLLVTAADHQSIPQLVKSLEALFGATPARGAVVSATATSTATTTTP